MICPKCGFSQPEDIYCASCGVNIHKFSRRKRKKQYILGACIALGCAAVLLAATYFYPFYRKPEKQDSQEKGSRTEQTVSNQKGSSESKTAGLTTDARTPEPQKDTKPPPRNIEKPPSPASADNRSTDKPPAQVEGERHKAQPEAAKGELTALQWFEKGRSLDNDSDEEIGYYKKTIELDPDFAPAHFRLGAIYFRQADYDLADQEFTKFLQFATEEDKLLYDIYAYYSLAEVELLSSKKEKTEAEGKSEGEEVQAETKREDKEGTETQEDREASQEAKATVKFSSVRGHIRIPVLLNGTLQADMLLDTGAGVTILTKEVAATLGLKINRSRSIALKTIANDVRVPLARLDSIQFGELRKREFTVAVSDLNLGGGGFDGILGMDFLGDYDIRIDKEKNEIVLNSATSSHSR